MEGNLSEPLSLIEIADHVGLSRRQIERLFRTEMGRSPARYYLEIRLDRARHLLIQSSDAGRRGGGGLRLRLGVAFLEMLQRNFIRARRNRSASTGSNCWLAWASLFLRAI